MRMQRACGIFVAVLLLASVGCCNPGLGPCCGYRGPFSVPNQFQEPAPDCGGCGSCGDCTSYGDCGGSCPVEPRRGKKRCRRRSCRDCRRAGSGGFFGALDACLLRPLGYQQAGCGPLGVYTTDGCSRCDGCGDVYRGDYASDPPDLCDPCDCYGNYTGERVGMRPGGRHFYDPGEPYPLDAQGTAYDGVMHEGEVIYEGDVWPHGPHMASPPIEYPSSVAPSRQRPQTQGPSQSPSRLVPKKPHTLPPPAEPKTFDEPKQPEFDHFETPPPSQEPTTPPAFEEAPAKPAIQQQSWRSRR